MNEKQLDDLVEQFIHNRLIPGQSWRIEDMLKDFAREVEKVVNVVPRLAASSADL